MEELIILIIQFLFELFFDVIINIPFDWPSKKRKTPERERIFLICFAWCVLGCGIGAGSIFLVGHSFIASPSLRILNLIVAPFLSAFIAEYIASERAITNKNIIPRNHFWQAFCFTLGLVTIRFIYAS